MRTVDIKFAEMCDDIDFWKAEAKHYKQQYEEAIRENARQTHERLEEAKRGVGQALMLALSISDNGDGSISISKENRKVLAESFKTADES